MTRAQVRKFLKDHGIRFILAQFVDLHGAAKAKAVPASHVDDLLGAGAGFAGFAVLGLGMGPHGPDFMAVGDPTTLKPMPWMDGYARMACYGHVKGKPYPYDARVALKREVDKLAAGGYTLYTGIEPEFLLLARSADGKLVVADRTDTLDKPCYDYKGLARSRVFLEKLVGALQQADFDVYQIDHEDSNGQFEVNYTYSDCLTTADNLIYFKMAASEIAHDLGMVATFMPKPFANRTGTGAHFHISLGQGKTKNVFHDDRDRHGLGLSQTGYHFLAGLLAHAPGLAALCAPSVNSYKRLVVGRSLSGATWAPAYIAYGDNNRTACVRIPYGRIELRLPDGSCNPYLATLGIIAAGMDGIARKLDAGAPCNDNLYEYSAAQLAHSEIGLLPQNLGDALDAFEADPVLRAGVGEDLSTEFLRLKRMEWVEYQRHVSEWETERYLELF
ncbi:MAG: type III glutamate--ammonia ligase [Proteobacteria bacterium]|nr:type III glutamate--ammonia ligase [Burkholderiales bacterium]